MDQPAQIIHVEGPNGERRPLEVIGSLPPAMGPGKRARRVVGRDTSPLTAGLTSNVIKRKWREDDALELIKAIRDLDPMVSEAVWNYLRLMNPGHDLRVFNFAADGSETEERGAAQNFIDELVRRIAIDYGGGLDQLHNVLALTLLTHGAVALEVAPSFTLDNVLDWYPVDPSLLAYQQQDDGSLVLGQVFRDGRFVPVNPEQVFYQPLDPDVNLPYGRMPLLGAIQAVLAKSALIADVRAAAHNQGFPRIDVKVLWEKVLESAPPSLKAVGSEAEMMQWADRQLSTIIDEYEKLAVDDTFVHYDWVELDMVGSTTPGGTSFNFKELDRILTEQLNAALKALPILNGTMDTNEHGHGSIQWQIQVAGISALQHVLKRLIERAANTSLAIAGLPGHAKMIYDPIRSVDRLYEAQSELFEAKSLQIDVMMGWKSNDEAAMARAGHKAVGPIPNQAPTGNVTDLNANNSGDKNPGAGGDAPTTPADAEKGQSGQEQATWALLSEPAIPDFRFWTDSRQLDLEAVEEDITELERRATVIFYSSMDVLITTLQKEGYELRDVPKDVADYVFGLRYSREMKALLREAILRGMKAAGEIDPVVDERLVNRIWNENRQYVLKLRDDLKAALRAGEFTTLDDIRRWFDRNARREELMGRYLAKQGITGGYALSLSNRRGSTLKFTWRLGIAEHCTSCLARNGRQYTYSELLSVGLPGSSALECGANCKCSLEEQS